MLVVFEEIMQNIRKEIRSNFVYISFDETTDARGCFVANLVIGVGEKEKKYFFYFM